MKKRLKIWVYAIAKNEEKFVPRFLTSCFGADGVAVLDTGSTDNTVKLLRHGGAKVKQHIFSPFRFDHARQMALSMVPKTADICVVLDLDEVLPKGWREKLERDFKDNDRIKFPYVWSHKADGTPDVMLHREHIHRRLGYVWKHPVHEMLYWTGTTPEIIGYSDLEVHHWPDGTKGRKFYLDLLALGTKEMPEHSRTAFYYGRELFFNSLFRPAVKELERYLKLPMAGWYVERAEAMRIIAECYLFMDEGKNPDGKLMAEIWYLRAVAENPVERDHWLNLAQFYLDNGNPLGASFAAQKAVRITNRPRHFIATSKPWGPWPYDIFGTALFQLENFKHAYEMFYAAHQMDPKDERIKKNLELLSQKMDNHPPMIGPTGEGSAPGNAVLKILTEKAKRKKKK